MFTQTLLPDTLRAIKLIDPSRLPAQTYLAGGTALTLQLGHRISVDLDFFTTEKFDGITLASEFGGIETFSLERAAPLTLLGKIGKTKISLFSYPYPLIEATASFEGIVLAGTNDIAAMKIHALSDRGARRDFIDVYFLAQRFSLEEMLEFYEKKYRRLEERLYHILRSLNYFDDAETEDMPKMLAELSWDKLKKFFVTEALRLYQKQFGT